MELDIIVNKINSIEQDNKRKQELLDKLNVALTTRRELDSMLESLNQEQTNQLQVNSMNSIVENSISALTNEVCKSTSSRNVKKPISVSDGEYDVYGRMKFGVDDIEYGICIKDTTGNSNPRRTVYLGSFMAHIMQAIEVLWRKDQGNFILNYKKGEVMAYDTEKPIGRAYLIFDKKGSISTIKTFTPNE